jgi:hypothetical protein
MAKWECSYLLESKVPPCETKCYGVWGSNGPVPVPILSLERDISGERTQRLRGYVPNEGVLRRS